MTRIRTGTHHRGRFVNTLASHKHLTREDKAEVTNQSIHGTYVVIRERSRTHCTGIFCDCEDHGFEIRWCSLINESRHVSRDGPIAFQLKPAQVIKEVVSGSVREKRGGQGLRLSAVVPCLG